MKYCLIIHEDQTCTVLRRHATDALIAFCDEMLYYTERKLGATLLTLDIEKVYDRVTYTFLFKVLREMGFLERLVQWIQLIYEQVESRKFRNENISNAFKILLGVRQGCPVSPILYVDLV